MATIRQQIWVRIYTELSAIGALKRVYRVAEGQPLPSVSEYPSVILIDRGDRMRRRLPRLYENIMQAEAVVFEREWDPATRQTDADTAYNLVAAKIEEKRKWNDGVNNLAVNTEILSDAPSLGETTAPYASHRIAFEVRFRTKRDDPSTLGVV